MRKDEIMKLYPDIRKVKKTFNWKPSVEIKRGFKALLKAILIKKYRLIIKHYFNRCMDKFVFWI